MAPVRLSKFPSPIDNALFRRYGQLRRPEPGPVFLFAAAGPLATQPALKRRPDVGQRMRPADWFQAQNVSAIFALPTAVLPCPPGAHNRRAHTMPPLLAAIATTWTQQAASERLATRTVLIFTTAGIDVYLGQPACALRVATRPTMAGAVEGCNNGAVWGRWPSRCMC